jgi:hypothetical protein
MGVTSFQVPAYLAVAARDLPGRDRLEATYALLRRAARTEPFTTDASAALVALDAAAAGEAGSNGFAAGVVEVVRRIRAGEFPIAPRA